MLYQVHLTMSKKFELTMSMVINTDCIGSYHSIKTVPPSEVKKFCLVSTIWTNTTNYMIQFPPSSNYLIQIYHHRKQFSDSVYLPTNGSNSLIPVFHHQKQFADSIYPPSEAIIWFSLPTHHWKQFSDSIFHHRKQFSWFHFSPSEAILRFNLPLHQKQYSLIPFFTIGSNSLIQFTPPSEAIFSDTISHIWSNSDCIKSYVFLKSENMSIKYVRRSVSRQKSLKCETVIILIRLIQLDFITIH